MRPFVLHAFSVKSVAIDEAPGLFDRHLVDEFQLIAHRLLGGDCAFEIRCLDADPPCYLLVERLGFLFR